MKDQLFKNKPDFNLVTNIIKLFGLLDINDINLFTKQNLIDILTFCSESIKFRYGKPR